MNKRVQHICIWLREMSTDKVLEGIAVKRWRKMFLLLATTVLEDGDGRRGRGFKKQKRR